MCHVSSEASLEASHNTFGHPVSLGAFLVPEARCVDISLEQTYYSLGLCGPGWVWADQCRRTYLKLLRLSWSY